VVERDLQEHAVLTRALDRLERARTHPREVLEAGAARIQLRHERIAEGRPPGERRLNRVGPDAGEGRRRCAADDVRSAARIDGDALFRVPRRAAEVGGVQDLRARGVELRDDRVEVPRAAGIRRLRGARADARKVGARRRAGDVRVAGAVDGDPPELLPARAAEEGAERRGGAGRIDLRHEAVEPAARVRRLERARPDAREGRRARVAADERVAAAVDGDARSEVAARAAEERRVVDAGAVGGQLRDERVLEAWFAGWIDAELVTGSTSTPRAGSCAPSSTDRVAAPVLT
jgi:hypothetical protein